MKKKLNNKITAVVLLIAMLMTQSAFTFADAEPVDELMEEPVKAEMVLEAPSGEEAIAAEEAIPEGPAEEPVGEVPATAAENTKEPAAEQISSASSAEPEKAAATTVATEKKATASKAAAENTVKNSGNEQAASFAFDNSTNIPDGTYEGDAVSFSFTGGTGKTSFTVDKVIIEGGKATAVLTTSSANMTHLYLAHTADQEDDKSIYDPDTDTMAPGVYRFENKRVTIPVRLGEETDFAGRTVAMGAPHWIQYAYTLTIDVPAETDFDNTTDLKDGTYSVDEDHFVFTGGTGKAKLTPASVTVKNGRATAEFTASSDKMTHVYLGEASSNNEDPDLYDPSAGKTGKDVFAINDKKVTVPVAVNKETNIAARTTAMGDPHWINYHYTIIIDKDVEPSDNPSDQDKEDDKDKNKDKESQEQPVTPSTKQQLKDGTYKVLSTTDRKMFYLYPKEQVNAYSILTVKNGKMTATITLTGDGYDYVYMGTPAQAKKAGKAKWIKAKIVNGYYTFTIPVSKLDTKLTITPHSRKYEEDGDPRTEPWRSDKWIEFYSGNAVKIKDGETSTADKAKKKDSSKKKESGATSGKQTKFKNDNKKDKESKWQDDSSGSTTAVDASTTLKDGVYTPDSFSWSGGSGRLAYIRCNKITVTNGQAYATIEFGSSSYDALRANGRVYSKNGGGNSTFVIPVKLNANNTIIGRTTAMSQPHWVEYTIYIGKAESAADAAQAKEAKKEAAEAKMKISDKAPTINGLKAAKEETVKVEYAKYFKVFSYEDGVKLLSIDISQDTELKKAYTDNAKKAMEASESKEDVEYDDDGNVIIKTANEYTEALYRNNIINYLLVPEKFEVPAGLEKEYIIVRVPSKKTVMASPEAITMMEDLDCLDAISLLTMDEKDVSSKALKKALKDEKVEFAGTLEKPAYKSVVKNKADLVILPGDLLPAKIKKDAKDKDKLKEEAEAKKAELEKLESRFTTLDVPVIVDRSAQEKDELAQAEWIKVYGVLYGCEDEADKAFDELVKKADKK